MKIDFTKIKKGVKKVLNVFWRHLFLTFIAFMLISTFLSVMIYYEYYLKTKDSGLITSNTMLTVNKALMDDIFSKWDMDAIKAKEAENTVFPDFFRGIESNLEELSEEILENVTTSTEEELTE